jgi:hypothetical protein
MITPSAVQIPRSVFAFLRSASCFAYPSLSCSVSFMHRGMGKVSCSRGRSSGGHPYDDRPRHSAPHLPSDKTSSDTAHPISAPSSYLDTSIPFNLPPRRSMKMLKDGSDFVWPDAAHALFVRGALCQTCPCLPFSHCP